MSQNDFKEFIHSHKSPSLQLDQQILASQKRLGRRNKLTLFFKVTLLHLIAGIITLSICPQFGWNPFNIGHDLSQFFMQYGMWACGLFCGSIFIGTGSILKYAFLDLKKLAPHQHQLLRNTSIISFIYLCLLMVIGKDAHFISIEFALSWFIGALFIEYLSKVINRLVQSNTLSDGLPQ